MRNGYEEGKFKEGIVMKANGAPEKYSMQFRDKIDEYLWKEHHILGGCCSSIESMKYAVAREVAEKLTDAFIKKAREWLNKESESYVKTGGVGVCVTYEGLDVKELVEDFSKYMKGE